MLSPTSFRDFLRDFPSHPSLVKVTAWVHHHLHRVHQDVPLCSKSQHQARQWVQEVCGVPALAWLCHGHEPCPHIPTLQRYLFHHVERHKPLTRSLQRGFFWKNTFALNPWTLDPRPETEGVVDIVCRHNTRHLQGQGEPAQGGTILDMGTGTGCLILSLLQELPSWKGLGVDAEERVFAPCRRNAQAMGLSSKVQWLASHWWQNVPPQQFSYIVTNPPYIATCDLATLPLNVQKWDPPKALDGGADGLACYRSIIPQAAQRLTPQGLFVAEIGALQGPQVLALAQASFPYSLLRQDLAGRNRYCLAAHHNFFPYYA